MLCVDIPTWREREGLLNTLPRKVEPPCSPTHSAVGRSCTPAPATPLGSSSLKILCLLWSAVGVQCVHSRVRPQQLHLALEAAQRGAPHRDQRPPRQHLRRLAVQRVAPGPRVCRVRRVPRQQLPRVSDVPHVSAVSVPPALLLVVVFNLCDSPLLRMS